MRSIHYMILLIMLLIAKINTAQSIEEFESQIDSLMKEYTIPGAGIALISNDSIYYTRVFEYRRLGES